MAPLGRGGESRGWRPGCAVLSESQLTERVLPSGEETFALWSSVIYAAQRRLVPRRRSQDQGPAVTLPRSGANVMAYHPAWEIETIGLA